MSLIIPVAWGMVTAFFTASLLIAFIFLYFSEYSRIEVVTGALQPDAGVAQVTPTRAGVITQVSVIDGDRVRAGAPLVAVRAEEDGSESSTPAKTIVDAIHRQDISLAAQADASMIAYTAQIGHLKDQKTGLLSEINQIENQLRVQSELVVSAEMDVNRSRIIAGRGFISGRDLQAREENLLLRRQVLSQLHQTLAAKHAQLAENRRSQMQILAQAGAQSASFAASRAQVAQQAASATGARSYVLRSPISGEVTAVTAKVGQFVTPRDPIMQIVPAGSNLRAELLVPSSAIGFVKAGQEVRLAIDAFPYQRFGTVSGVIETVPASAVKAPGPNGTILAVYPVSVVLRRGTIDAYGRTEPLISGMSLTARIVTEKQTMFEWLFEPVFAVRKR